MSGTSRSIHIPAFEMARWGEDLDGRTLGARARAELEAMVEAAAAPVTVDFAGVGTMSASFADECFGKLIRRMRTERLPGTLRFTNANDPVATMLRFIAERAQRPPFSVNPHPLVMVRSSSSRGRTLRLSVSPLTIPGAIVRPSVAGVGAIGRTTTSP
jgi:uncharacterized protein DUF4325